MDVNEIIYDFLLFSKNHNKFLCISKQINEEIKSSNIMKQYFLFNNRINMIKEDENYFNKFDRKNNKLFKLWKKYNLYKWYNVKKYNGLWKTGDIVDAYDFVKGWCPAKILTHSIEKKSNYENSKYSFEFYRAYEILFLGWDDKFIEKVDIDKIAPLGKYTLDPYNIYDNLIKDASHNSFWSLCKKKHEKEWNMHKITDKIIDNNTIKLLTNLGDVFVIKKDNVHDVIRYISDASTFFSINSDYCFFKRRSFTY